MVLVRKKNIIVNVVSILGNGVYKYSAIENVVYYSLMINLFVLMMEINKSYLKSAARALSTSFTGRWFNAYLFPHAHTCEIE